MESHLAVHKLELCHMGMTESMMKLARSPKYARCFVAGAK